MVIKTEQVKNKYDPKTVQAALNDFFSHHVEEEFKGTKEWKIESLTLVVRAVLAVIILKSYFHADSFPNDKPLILFCLVAYWVLNLLLSALEKHRNKSFFAFFEVEKSNVPVELKGFRKAVGKESFELKVGSETEWFKSNYKLILEVEGKKAEKTVQYERYMDSEGNLDQAKLKELFRELLQSMGGNK